MPYFVPLTLKGSGVFGNVIEAYDTFSDHRVAIKCTHKCTNKVGREYYILWKLQVYLRL